jgi:hypothetical protein
LCPKEAVVSERFKPPVKGNRIIGKREVTAMGIASVIHQTATHRVLAKIAFASSLKPSG